MSIGFEVTGAVSVPEGLLKIARRFSAPCSRRTETPGYFQSFLRDDEVEIPAAAGEATCGPRLSALAGEPVQRPRSDKLMRRFQDSLVILRFRHAQVPPRHGK